MNQTVTAAARQRRVARVSGAKYGENVLPSGMKPGARDVWGCRLHVWGCRLHARVAGFVGTTSQFYFHYGYLRTANLLLTGVVGVKATLLTTYLLLTHYLLA